jgi:23S rRNA pseudouridine1911/1915/1917 synthase
MTGISKKALVPPELAGERVDKIAATMFDDFSRATLSRWISDGSLTVNGERIKAKARLNGGESLELAASLQPREDWNSAQSVKFSVEYEDDDLLVVNKPPGVVVHPGAGNRDGTLVNGLLKHRPDLALLPRAGIVHRLDKDTSGLLLVAATLVAHHRLVKDLQARTISRHYQAVVEGVMISGLDIDSPIGRDPHRRTLQRVRPDGREAHTRVRVTERFRNHSLIAAQLMTGRTHQIRVHLSSVGHPLVGDRRYGARDRLPAHPDPQLVGLVRNFSRQALHAQRLAFAHPRHGEPVEFVAQLPEDLVELLDALRSDRESYAG